MKQQNYCTSQTPQECQDNVNKCLYRHQSVWLQPVFWIEIVIQHQWHAIQTIYLLCMQQSGKRGKTFKAVMSYCVLLLSSTLSLLLSFRRVPNGMSQSLEEIPNPTKRMKVCKLIYWKWLIGRPGLIHYVSGHEVDGHRGGGEEGGRGNSNMCTLSMKASFLLAKMVSSTMLMPGGQNCSRVLKWMIQCIFFLYCFFFCSWVTLHWPDIIHVTNETGPSSFFVALRF